MNNEKQIGLDCIDLITKKHQGEMTRDQFYTALIELHNKYPTPGHNPPLTTFQITNYKTIKMKVQDPMYDVIYEDHLQPSNFIEAAEMYKQSLDKRDEGSIPYKAWRKKKWPTKEVEEPEVRDKKVESTGETIDEAPF